MKEFDFDDAYGKVYAKNGVFLYSYYECGISAKMSESKKNKLVEEKENYFFHKANEEAFSYDR